MNNSNYISTVLRLMMPIFQQGFYLECRLGENVKSMLVSELEMDSEYVDRRIATIFINGKAVDDMETARLTNGCALTLSGAMPGLVGACFRKSGQYASLRSVISYVPENEMSSCDRGLIKIKLFNTLIYELGPMFLQKGILVDESQYVDLIDQVDKYDLKSTLRNHISRETTCQGLHRIQLSLSL